MRSRACLVLSIKMVVQSTGLQTLRVIQKPAALTYGYHVLEVTKIGNLRQPAPARPKLPEWRCSGGLGGTSLFSRCRSLHGAYKVSESVLGFKV